MLSVSYLELEWYSENQKGLDYSEMKHRLNSRRRLDYGTSGSDAQRYLRPQRQLRSTRNETNTWSINRLSSHSKNSIRTSYKNWMAIVGVEMSMAPTYEAHRRTWNLVLYSELKLKHNSSLRRVGPNQPKTTTIDDGSR